jgi:hypothetical protein
MPLSGDFGFGTLFFLVVLLLREEQRGMISHLSSNSDMMCYPVPGDSVFSAYGKFRRHLGLADMLRT